MKDYQLSEPVFLRNLVVHPIKGISKKDFSPSTIDEVLKSGHAFFRERDTPDINKIIFENRSNSPLLLLDGEEITGSLQNRIIAASTLVDAQSSKNISVICAEEGRWDEIGGFRTGYCSYPRIRALLAQSQHRDIDIQRSIWNEINRKLTTTKTISTTSSMHDIFNHLEDEITRYVEDFQSLNHDTVGFVGVVGNRILGVDIFSRTELYQKFENKLIRSYALDAIEYKRTDGRAIDVNTFFKSIIKSLEIKKFGLKNKNIVIKKKGFIAQGIGYKNHIIHLSSFPN